MKRVWMFLAALLLLPLAGCGEANDPQTLAALENVMAIADYAPPEEEEAPAVEWAGTYENESRSITLEQDPGGAIRYRVSDGESGCAEEVSGAAAKTEELCFSLSGDTLSVVGGVYTGNYQRR